MPKPRNYKNACIYKIVCKNPEIEDFYIGSTTNFRARKYRHKSNCKCNETIFLYDFIRANGDWANWDMILLETCKNIENARQLEKKEREYFDELKPTLNQKKPYITTEESKSIHLKLCKEWQKKNPEKKKQANRQYYNNNSEKEKQRKRNYYNKNSEKLKQANREYIEKNSQLIECKCGSKVKKYNYCDHLKTKKHQNYINK
jgi:methionine synthase I (cobalamin-dependent)